MVTIRKNSNLKPLAPVFLIFVILTAVFAVARTWLERKGVDVGVAMFGNLILFAITLISYRLLHRATQSSNIHAFTRMMYVNFIVKFFVILGIVVVYALTTKEINKAAVIICVIIYLTYTMIESAALTKLVKRKNNV